MDHIKGILESTNELINSLNLPIQQKSSVLYLVNFMGDHINGKFYKLLQQQHLDKFEAALDSNELSAGQLEQML